MPLRELRVAQAAIETARRPGIRRWSPQGVASAEEEMDRARRILRSAADRWLPHEGLAEAAAGFDRAHRLAIDALRNATALRRQASSDSTRVLAEARAALRDVEAAALLVEPSAAQRASLFRARVAITDSAAREASGDHLGAAARAAFAEQEARTVLAALIARARRYQDGDLVELWERWARETIDESRRTGSRAVLVVKERNEVVVIEAGRAVARFDADMGWNSTARKLHSGDRATPEGRYRISARKDPGQSTYYRAFLLDYPNATDRKRLRGAVAAGSVRRGVAPGSAIEIHGEGGRGQDWTDGCVALSNDDMDRLARLVKVGTPVTIVGAFGGRGKFTALVDRLASVEGRRGS